MIDGSEILHTSVKNRGFVTAETPNTPILKSKLTRNAVTALQRFPLMNCNQNELNFEFTIFSL